VLKQLGTINDKSINELLDLTNSCDLFERIIGVATLNALSQTVLKDMVFFAEGNLIDVLEVESTDTVTMIGGIKPFIESITHSSKN
jgi:uncharacterized protein (DUF4213/DUF364 family)